MKLSEKLMKIRKENGLSQEEFGNEINVSRQAVSKWESEQTKLDIDKIQEIAKRFNVSFDYLLNDEIDTEEKKVEETIKKKNGKIIVKIILAVVCIYLLISFYKFAILFKFYKIADSFSEEKYWMNMGMNFNNEVNIDRDITIIGNQRLEVSYQTKTDGTPILDEDNERIPYEIEFIDSNQQIAYKLNYDEEKQKYIYYDRKADAVTEEEWNDILNVERDGIKETTLNYIPSSLKEIIQIAVNPFNKVSAKNHEIYINNFNKGKIIIGLNKDYLLNYYVLQTEMNGTVKISISYDYVQDHFTDLENPLETYRDKIIEIGSQEARELDLYEDAKIEGTYYDEYGYETDSPSYIFSEDKVELAGNDCYTGTYTIEGDEIKIKYYEYTPPVEEPQPFEGEETLKIIDENTLEIVETSLYDLDADYDGKYIKDLY